MTGPGDGDDDTGVGVGERHTRDRPDSVVAVGGMSPINDDDGDDSDTVVTSMWCVIYLKYFKQVE